jgi:hypothetical protein
MSAANRKDLYAQYSRENSIISSYFLQSQKLWSLNFDDDPSWSNLLGDRDLMNEVKAIYLSLKKEW